MDEPLTSLFTYRECKDSRDGAYIFRRGKCIMLTCGDFMLAEDHNDLAEWVCETLNTALGKGGQPDAQSNRSPIHSPSNRA